ncbi:hypothetical protein [Prolixibacter bellariivorans]|uniref:hypothetical protein n=1 Tax=Prolixibacter bellariivorans TaxID=314319 RepID=UPI001298F106|nr:hypothetical protein [Prolixibacter bellariivorans]
MTCSWCNRGRGWDNFLSRQESPPLHFRTIGQVKGFPVFRQEIGQWLQGWQTGLQD